MYDPDEINPHLALWRSETRVDPAEQAWLRWCADVEKLIGHKLDGDQQADGYSLDFAYGLWEAGYTPADMATEIAEQKAVRR